uniref:Reverse transcriptase domain-containing protein n=1 Tax=Schistosoma curassoni TaxID=6186 RepID=A0A183K830_9TREM
MAIKQIKSGKAAGPDNIPTEALKADVAATARILHTLFSKIWDEKQVPEIMMFIRQIRSGKAAGSDNLPAEAPKSDITAKMLHVLFKKIWEEEQVLKDWKEGYLINILKGGDFSRCENKKGNQQAGFRKDRSFTNRISTLIVVEQSVEWNSSLYINFLDYEKAFDSMDRRTFWKLPRHYSVPEKIVNII